MLLSFERSRRIRAIVGFNDGYFFSGFDVGSREGRKFFKNRNRIREARANRTKEESREESTEVETRRGNTGRTKAIRCKSTE